MSFLGLAFAAYGRSVPWPQTEKKTRVACIGHEKRLWAGRFPNPKRKSAWKSV